MPSLRQLRTRAPSNPKSAGGRDIFKSKSTAVRLLTRKEKMICNRIAWYIAIGQTQVLPAPGASEASHFSYQSGLSKAGIMCGEYY